MVVAYPEGAVIEGTLKASVDTGIHLNLYYYHTDILGITHCHSPYASSFAARGERNSAVLAPITHMPGLDIHFSRYATPGDLDTGQAIIEAANGGNSFLVKPRGVFTMDTSATESLSFAMYLEEAVMTFHLAICRGPIQELPHEEIERCYNWFPKDYGQ